MGKSVRKREVEKLDKVFSEYIRLRDKRCITCGSTNRLQNSHYLGRRALATRWDEQNCNAQCAGCHMQFHNDNCLDYTRAMIDKYGKEVVERLERLHNTSMKIPTEDLTVLRKAYEKKVEKMR